MSLDQLYGTLSVLVVVVHFGFIVFVMFGGLLALRFRAAPLAHLPAAAWGAWIELSGGVCPLTPLENRLRQAAGDTEYPGSFIEHYVLRIVYPPGLTPEIQLALGVGAIALNVGIYAWVVRVRRRRAALSTDADRG